MRLLRAALQGPAAHTVGQPLCVEKQTPRILP